MPTDKTALFAAIQHVSHIIRANANELVQVVAEAKQKGVTGPELNDVLKKISEMKEAEWAKRELNDVLKRISDTKEADGGQKRGTKAAPAATNSSCNASGIYRNGHGNASRSCSSFNILG